MGLAMSRNSASMKKHWIGRLQSLAFHKQARGLIKAAHLMAGMSWPAVMRPSREKQAEKEVTSARQERTQRTACF
jgi:hypothetical protein